MGQKNKLTYRWARKGSRPRAAHDQRTQSTYLFGAVCPERGAGAALVLPACNCEAMQLHLDEIATKVALGAHAITLLDQAGWHGAKALVVPNNISLVPLPARAPAEDALEGDFRSKSDCLRQPILGANQLVSTSSPHSASAPQTSRGTSCITSMTSEPKCFHSAKWWRTCGRLVGFATCLRCLGRMRRSAGGRRFPVKCDNGLLCDLRTRSTEAVAGPCYVRRSLLSRKCDLDVVDMHKNIGAAVIGRDKAISAICVEEFDPPPRLPACPASGVTMIMTCLPKA